MRQFTILAFAFLCSGCVTNGVTPPPTASGRPETTIANAGPDKIKPILVSEMANAGYRITKDTPYELAFDKPVQNLAAAVLLGSRYDAQPNARITYTFAQLGNDTRVIADMAVITNPGSAFERRTPMNGGVDAYDLQSSLDRLKMQLDPNSPLMTARKNKIVLGIGEMAAERAKLNGRTVPEHGLYIATIVPGSVAEQAGMKVGDTLIRFNGVDVRNEVGLSSAQAAVRPGSSVKMIVWRAGDEIDMTAQFPKVESPARPSQKRKHVS